MGNLNPQITRYTCAKVRYLLPLCQTKSHLLSLNALDLVALVNRNHKQTAFTPNNAHVTKVDNVAVYLLRFVLAGKRITYAAN